MDRPPLPDSARIPHPSRLDPRHPGYRTILACHEAAMAAGRPTYRDPATGFEVFTARYLWERGTCCDSGCRHCPYL
jgi:hypothetical protein